MPATQDAPTAAGSPRARPAAIDLRAGYASERMPSVHDSFDGAAYARREGFRAALKVENPCTPYPPHLIRIPQEQRQYCGYRPTPKERPGS